MRIDRIELDGFGRFHDAHWSLGPGLTVILGDNEAGKTTFLNGLRALLFGFEATREGRTWYPAFAGGRRGGRLVLTTAAEERWVVERHGERGGGGALAVRAPNGNQGGQETLDRLLRGADRDLFTNIFAFGLGELQDLHTLSTTGVRGRIYGAGAGLGGTSAVDLERDLRGELRETFVPSGTKPPLNTLLVRIERLRGEIAELSSQPADYEVAHRERDGLEARSAGLRDEVRGARERMARLGHLRQAAPILAELGEIERELVAGDSTLDLLSHDVAVILDRRLVDLDAANRALRTIDEELDDARRECETVRVDRAVLDAADAIAAARDASLARSAARDRRRDLSADEVRQAAIVAEQVAKVGGWEEARLLALDDSIPSIQATRDAEERLARTRAEAGGSEARWRAAAQDLLSREREVVAASSLGDVDARRAALREIDVLRGREEAARAPATSPAARGFNSRMLVVVAALLAMAGFVVGLSVGQPLAGAVGGAALGVALIALVTVFAPRPSGDSPPDLTALRRELLERAGLAPGATDAEIATLADELATARARSDLAQERALAVEHRRDGVRRFERERDDAVNGLHAAEEAWGAWLAERGMGDGLAPAAAREMLGAAGIARGAAKERERLSALMVVADREEAEHAARTDALFAGLGVGPVRGDDERAAAVLALADRLERARTDERHARELEIRIRNLEERRTPAAEDVVARGEAVEQHLSANGSLTPDALRQRDISAVERRAQRVRSRELRSELAGIAGSPEAIDDLATESRQTDGAAVEAQLGEAAAEVDRIEAEQAEVRARIGELSARIRQLEAAEELGTKRQELAVAEGTAAALARDWAVRAVTLHLLEETRQRYERERQPDVVRAAEAHFSRFTAGRYARIVAPPGDSSVRVETEGGEGRVTDELSRGTAEQLYLALRFGLIEEFARHAEPLPVVMDDILVNFDVDRASRAAGTIRDLATRHQVIYFTCHAWTAELLDPEGARTVALA
ncbi:MAG: AAA family ATPase [Chloroflexota bacterium]|nr:AAA family ATPase [Chloroflexota bacterium]